MKSLPIWQLSILFISLVGLFVPDTGLAQQPETEQNEAAEPAGKLRSAFSLPDNLTGQLTAGLDKKDTTVDSLAFTLGLSLKYVRNDGTWNLNANRQFAEAKSKIGDQTLRQTIANNYSSSISYTHQLRPNLGIRAVAGHYRSKPKGIDSDRSAILLPKFTVWQAERGMLLAGAGVGHRVKRIRLLDNSVASNSSAAYGVSTEFQYQLTPGLAFSKTIFAYSDFGNNDDDSVEFSASLAQAITRNLSIQLSYQFSFHEQPLRPDIDDTTTHIQLQLSYRL